MNPCELNGLSFIEFSSIDPNDMRQKFKNLGFTKIATHASKPFEIWQQNQIFFLLNQIPNTGADAHANIHQAGACAMGFQTHLKREEAHAIAINRGAKNAPPHPVYQLPGIEGIGASVIYFTDASCHLFDDTWQIHDLSKPKGHGLVFIDHLTHNVHRGQLRKWSDFYAQIFNFKPIRNFDIQGQHTGLYSEALGSPCGKIKIPLNESKDEKSQIEEFLKDYHGEGIQHIALHTSDIYETVKSLKKNHIHFLDTPNTYFDLIETRLPWQQEPIDVLRNNKILIDGGPTQSDGILLQIFTENIFGPVFFEIIQRKGHPGFGEGNFQALFDAIERDQLLRGSLELE